MHFKISNQTHDTLLCHLGRDVTDECVLARPFSESAEFPSRHTFLSFSKCPQKGSFKELVCTIGSAISVTIKPGLSSGRTWERVTTQGDIPWVIYRNRISRKCHVLVVFPYRDTSCFLADIPDSVPLSSLMLPGTHETMAFYGWPISQCQLQPLDTQLHAGIRVVDIRLSIVSGRLVAYHGIFPEVAPFADVLVTLHDFLTSAKTATETIVVSIKQEDSDTTLFPKLVRDEIVASPGGLQMWFLENRIPDLGEVRGRAVMFSRFSGEGWENGVNGIHPPLWPDSVKEGFEWECDGTLVHTRDWYDISSFLSTSEKTELCTEILVPPVGSSGPTLSISFMSASSIPFALPPMIARGFGWPKWGLGFEGVNERLGKWLLDQLSSSDTKRRRGLLDRRYSTGDDARLCSRADRGPRVRGWALMDYYEDPGEAGVVRLFVECNFRGRRGGEEGW